MRIVVLGCGNIGTVVARDLAESLPRAEIVLADVDRNNAQDAAANVGLKNLGWMQADAAKHLELSTKLKNFDVVVGALPGKFGYRACKASIAAKVDMVDVSYMPEDVMSLNDVASKAGVSIVPDCGMSPGFCSMLVGRGVSKLDQVEKAHMLNGGLPETPVPPLGYVITWSVKDLIDMYVRKVNILKDGKITQVEPLSGLEELDFPGIGKLEAFYTDGLRTLLYTIKAKDMWEKTLRYPGHVEKIKLLKALGFFDSDAIEIGKAKVEPREVTADLFARKLKRKIPDIVVIRVKVSGKKDGRQIGHVYHVFDHYDSERRVTSMAERLGMNERWFERFIGEMKKRGIVVGEEETA
jgi:lysine 6-dehydrogenase